MAKGMTINRLEIPEKTLLKVGRWPCLRNGKPSWETISVEAALSYLNGLLAPIPPGIEGGILRNRKALYMSGMNHEGDMNAMTFAGEALNPYWDATTQEVKAKKVVIVDPAAIAKIDWFEDPQSEVKWFISPVYSTDRNFNDEIVAAYPRCLSIVPAGSMGDAVMMSVGEELIRGGETMNDETNPVDEMKGKINSVINKLTGISDSLTDSNIDTVTDEILSTLDDLIPGEDDQEVQMALAEFSKDYSIANEVRTILEEWKKGTVQMAASEPPVIETPEPPATDPVVETPAPAPEPPAVEIPVVEPLVVEPPAGEIPAPVVGPVVEPVVETPAPEVPPTVIPETPPVVEAGAVENPLEDIPDRQGLEPTATPVVVAAVEEEKDPHTLWDPDPRKSMEKKAEYARKQMVAQLV